MEPPQYFHDSYLGTPHRATLEKKAGTGGGGGDNFVEDLLNFPNDDDEEDDDSGGMLAPGDERAFDAAAGGSSTDSSTVTAVDSCGNSFSGVEQHFPRDLICQSFPDASLSADICEPHYGDLAELEWLSNFVDESSIPSEDLHKLHLISGINSTTTTTTSSSSSSASATAAAGLRREVSAIVPPVERSPQPPIFRPEGPVPGKARSKRSRAAPCNWSSRLLVLSPSRSETSLPESELIVPPSSAISIKKPAKPAKKKELMAAGPGVISGAIEGRKCLHCQTDKTPQWRTGPMGPKTLCNACGVRYKSGRLVPEYRPAASPTFILSKHSNSHRKVLELRRQKEIQQPQHLLSSAGGGASMFDGISPMTAAGEDFLIHHRLGPDFRQLI